MSCTFYGRARTIRLFCCSPGEHFLYNFRPFPCPLWGLLPSSAGFSLPSPLRFLHLAAISVVTHFDTPLSRSAGARLTRPLFASLATRLSIGICGIWPDDGFVVGRFSWIVPSSVRCTFCVVGKKRGFAAFDPHRDPVGRKKNITFSLAHFQCEPLEEHALPRVPRWY